MQNNLLYKGTAYKTIPVFYISVMPILTTIILHPAHLLRCATQAPPYSSNGTFYIYIFSYYDLVSYIGFII